MKYKLNNNVNNNASKNMVNQDKHKKTWSNLINIINVKKRKESYYFCYIY